MDEDETWGGNKTYWSPPRKRLGVRLTPKSRKKNNGCYKFVESSTPKGVSNNGRTHFGNITPIRFTNAASATVCAKRGLEPNSSASVQTEMLMLDESFMQTISLDKVESCPKEIGDGPGQTPHGDVLCLSPDMFSGEKIFSSDDDGHVVKVSDCEAVRHPSVQSVDKVLEVCAKDSCSGGLEGVGEVQMQSPAQQDASVSACWTDDSLLEEAVRATLLSYQASGLPVGEKIKKALQNNAQKAVTAKAKCDSSLDTTASHVNGLFFGLPARVQQLIEETRGISKLYSWQEDCLNLPAVNARKNLVVCLPTSGGKTLVAEVLILREVLRHHRNVLFVLPYVAIVQEKVRSLSSLAVPLGFLVEEYAAGRGTYPPRRRRWKNSVYVATIEKALGLVSSLLEGSRLGEVGLVVVDELHLLGDGGGRGANLEILLAKLLHTAVDLHIIGMSATIGNMREVATFLEAETFCQDFRPVELKEYIKCADRIFSISWSTDCPEEMCTLSRVISHKSTQDPDYVAGLVMEVVPDESVLVFCSTKKNCENVALLICRAMRTNKYLEHKLDEKKALYRALVSEGNGSVCSTLQNTLPFGVAYHHSGLMAGERRLLEEAFCSGTLCCICCTSTLAAGVNLPASRVVLRSPYIGTQFLTMSRYKQMVGRAGRAGTTCKAGESFLICSPAEVDKVRSLVSSSMDKCESSLEQGNGMKLLVLTAVAQGLACCRGALHRLARRTLLHVQAARRCLDVPHLVDQAIVQLFREGALRSPDVSPDQSICLPEGPAPTEGKRKVLLRSESFITVSKLGRAAIKGCMDLRKARMLYEDLVQAQASLVLLTCLHLLYLVTPYDLADQIKPNPHVFFSSYNELNTKEQQCAKILGLTEGCIMRIVNGRSAKNVPERVVRRFYLTMMLSELWKQETVWKVSAKYQVTRGFVQSLMSSAAAFASCTMRFCEELEEFWAFKDLLVNFSLWLSHCCTKELLPLMELPAVKKGRAQQLYNAGFKTLHDVANTSVEVLVSCVDHMSCRVARQIIAAAQLLLLEKVESLREEAQEVLEGMAVV